MKKLIKNEEAEQDSLLEEETLLEREETEQASLMDMMIGLGLEVELVLISTEEDTHDIHSCFGV